jgi:hypothetical protein
MRVIYEETVAERITKLKLQASLANKTIREIQLNEREWEEYVTYLFITHQMTQYKKCVLNNYTWCADNILIRLCPLTFRRSREAKWQHMC